MRARVALTNVVLAADEAMTPALITSTIQAYYYFYDEEKGSNLDLAHDALWKAFTSLGEVDNLLQLFRRSSILWQVRRRERIETKYLELLAPLVSNAVDRSLRLPKKEFQYYLARSNGGAKQAIVKTSNLEVTGPA
jgi:hypothetical protein